MPSSGGTKNIRQHYSNGVMQLWQRYTAQPCLLKQAQPLAKGVVLKWGPSSMSTPNELGKLAFRDMLFIFFVDRDGTINFWEIHP
jgi:hypothetical protein